MISKPRTLKRDDYVRLITIQYYYKIWLAIAMGVWLAIVLGVWLAIRDFDIEKIGVVSQCHGFVVGHCRF